MHGAIGEDLWAFKMSKFVSRYMLYLILLHPSMLPAGIGVLQYKDTSVEIQKFFEEKLGEMSKNESSVSSVVIKWVKIIFKKEKHFHAVDHFRTGVKSCNKSHKSGESRDLCKFCCLLLQMRTDVPRMKMRRGENRSVLFDACHLASQLIGVDRKMGLDRQGLGEVADIRGSPMQRP
ncbi:hypothetical protein NL676_006344 [Syzygium grande]|nr:hypothetical protein NL676_006344 [Syzygium grande]